MSESSAPSAPGNSGLNSLPRAACVAVGAELLSGKVIDRNLAHAIRELRGAGVPLVHAAIVMDDVPAIRDAVRYALDRAPCVITTGGVGPTHDDVTMEGVAAAVGRPLVRDASLEAGIRAWYGRHVNDDVLRMADLPEGTRLVSDPSFFLPLVQVPAGEGRTVHVFPGEPNHFRRQFDIFRASLAADPFVLSQVFLDVDEGEIARDLREVEARHRVAIGSYPKYDADAVACGYRVLVTIESKQAAAVAAATEDLVGRLRPGRLLRVERADSPSARLHDRSAIDPPTSPAPRGF